MKKNDIAVLILIAGFSLLVAYFAGQALIGQLKPATVQVEVVDKINANTTDPSPEIFNSNAINPAVPVNIGNSTNQQPFGQ